MPLNLVKQLTNIGFSDKAAKVYLAALDLGEATVQQLAKRSGVTRTTLYYTIDELSDLGALLETKRSKKTYYIPEKPQAILANFRERVYQFERGTPELENRLHSAYSTARTYFLYGVHGFKQVWQKIFSLPEKSFDIITSGENFLPYVNEKYILQEIIQKKKKIDLKSRQLIVDSLYARKIVAKDAQENRISKLLPPTYRLSFTTIISNNFVVFISPRSENLIIIVENDSFAKTQRALFNALWDKT